MYFILPLLFNTNPLKTGLINIAKAQLHNPVRFWEEVISCMHIMGLRSMLPQSYFKVTGCSYIIFVGTAKYQAPAEMFHM